MKIYVSKGTGTGSTSLAAFDSALVDAGIANFNLVYLSSVMPPGSDVIVTDKPMMPKGEWGDKLYVVIAQKRTTRRNQQVWAGIGWVQDSKTKKGLFVEHEGHSKAEVRADIEASMQGLSQNRGIDFGELHMEIAGVKCAGEPVCALAVAVFQSGGWSKAKINRFKIT